MLLEVFHSDLCTVLQTLKHTIMIYHPCLQYIFQFMNDWKETNVAEKQQLTLDDVRDIAELARLDLSDDELAMYTEQLSAILEYFTLLQEVDTSNIALTASVLPLRSVMREDVSEPALTPSEAVKNAPDAEQNQFRVLPVLDNE